MASWMEERDRLMEQTRAFVAGVEAVTAPMRVRAAPVPEDVASQQAPAVIALAIPHGPPVLINSIEPPRMPPRLKAVAKAASERAEISRRVAAFQAHQNRLSREREAFYDATQSKIRNKLGNELKTEKF